MAYSFGMASMSTQRYFNLLSTQVNKSLEKLSSGYRINHASDDAAGLVLSEQISSQIRGQTMAQSNIQQGLSMLNIADGSVQTMFEHLQTLKDIATEAASSTTTDFTALNAEFLQTVAAINSLSTNTEFNNMSLLDGSISGGSGMNIQVGPNSGDSINIQSAFADADATALGIALGAIASNANGTTLLTQVDTAINNLGVIAANIGGYQNRLESQSAYLDTSIENLTASYNTIRRTDTASEMANLTQLQILQEASAAMVAQANTQSALVLRLMGIT